MNNNSPMSDSRIRMMHSHYTLLFTLATVLIIVGSSIFVRDANGILNIILRLLILLGYAGLAYSQEIGRIIFNWKTHHRYPYKPNEKDKKEKVYNYRAKFIIFPVVLLLGLAFNFYFLPNSNVTVVEEILENYFFALLVFKFSIHLYLLQ